MTSSSLGASTLQPEVANIDRFGIWLLVDDREYFLPYVKFPWFQAARVEEILNVQLLQGDHLHWPELDVDLHLDSISKPEAFPLIYK
jgi:hypothetical protein